MVGLSQPQKPNASSVQLARQYILYRSFTLGYAVLCTMISALYYSGTPLIRTLVGPTASVLIREVSTFQGVFIVNYVISQLYRGMRIVQFHACYWRTHAA